MVVQDVPYQVEIEHDGRKYKVAIPALSVPKCAGHRGLYKTVDGDRQLKMTVNFRLHSRGKIHTIEAPGNFPSTGAPTERPKIPRARICSTTRIGSPPLETR